MIANEKEATDYLKVISYFRLANYLRPMELDKEKHLYKPNSYFENAIDLYYFDKFRGSWIKNTNLPMNKLYPQLCYLTYMQDRIHKNSTFKQQLKALLQVHTNVDIMAMGFPKDWEKEALWK